MFSEEYYCQHGVGVVIMHGWHIVLSFPLPATHPFLHTHKQELKAATAELIQDLSIFKDASTYPAGNPLRAIFCSRTLNLRSIQAIGTWWCTT